MLECLIVGDSIAVGVGQHRPECVTVAKVGITSKNWNKQFLDRVEPAKTVVVSLGANDYRSNTELHVRKLRIKLDTYRVYWILPDEKTRPDEVAAIKQVAKEFNDIVVPRPESHMSPDKVHPTTKGYKELAMRTK